MVVKILLGLSGVILSLNICNLYSNNLTEDFRFIIKAHENKDTIYSCVSKDIGNILWFSKYYQNKKSNTKTRNITTTNIVAEQMLIFYQKFISSQDTEVCMFTPTCSEFSKQAFKKYGFFWGFLMTSDRLQRCNGLGRNYYPIDIATGLAIDPVEKNYIFNR